MGPPSRICIIGQVLLDVMLGPENMTRLGGIIHTARTLSSIGAPYCLGYFAPEYLDEAVQSYCREWGAGEAVKIGNTSGAPNLIVIPDPKEVGSKNYELIWRKQQTVEYDESRLKRLLGGDGISDIIILHDHFPIQEMLKACGKSKARVYADINFGPDDFSELGALGREFETLIISTSATGFAEKYDGSPERLCSQLFQYCSTVLLKENRGGARLFGPKTSNNIFSAPAQVRPIAHSVGVGDCFNAVFVVMRQRFGEQVALNYASNLAAEYACNTRPEELQEVATAVLSIDPIEMADLHGVKLPWERRPEFNIYVAAPDFDWIDRRPIEEIIAALRYHNFTPRLPVRENGQMRATDDLDVKSRLASADVALLDQCELLLAVLLFDDPGTLIEIGMAIERRIPVLVYDPYGRASNPMLTALPDVVSPDLDRIIAGVFISASKVLHA